MLTCTRTAPPPPTSVALNSLMSVNMWLWHVMEAEEAAQELEQRRAAGIITDEEEQLQVGACLRLHSLAWSCQHGHICTRIGLPAWPGLGLPAAL